VDQELDPSLKVQQAISEENKKIKITVESGLSRAPQTTCSQSAGSVYTNDGGGEWVSKREIWRKKGSQIRMTQTGNVNKRFYYCHSGTDRAGE